MFGHFSIGILDVQSTVSKTESRRAGPKELKYFFNCNFLSFLVPIILSSRVIEYVVKRIDVKIVVYILPNKMKTMIDETKFVKDIHRRIV